MTTLVIEADPERRAEVTRLIEGSGHPVKGAADLSGAILEGLAAEEQRPNGRRGRPTLAELDRRYAAEILRQTGGNKTRAAEILGIDRKTLYRLIEPRPAGAAQAEAARADVDAGESAPNQH
ncbi:MAG: helix-turn-helix domain-containing protein [Anaeromyxobacter sp.]